MFSSFLTFSVGILLAITNAATQCTVIPPGSYVVNPANQKLFFPDPVVTGKCSTETTATSLRVYSFQFVCSGSTAAENIYNSSSCTGTPEATNPITLNGQCAKMECAGFTQKQYKDPGCSGNPQETIVNEYTFWVPGPCQYNQTQSCVGGQPQTTFYNNSKCTRNPEGIIQAGVCNRI
eukprot:UN03568